MLLKMLPWLQGDVRMAQTKSSGSPSNDLDSRELVAILYRGVFRREPDPASEAYVSMLETGNISVEGLVQIFVDSPEFKAAELVNRPQPFINEQSQYGEVSHLIRLMVNGESDRCLVDVGARGKERSNSFDLMNTFGWRGLLIEANPRLIDNIENEFAGLNVTVLNHAVSDFDGEATFHFGINDDVSSLTKETAEGWGEVQGQSTVQVRRLPALLDHHCVPTDFDLLSIDIEGEDVKVMNDTVAEGYTPRFVVIEASHDFSVTSLHDLPFSTEVRDAYQIVERTRANLILRLN